MTLLIRADGQDGRTHIERMRPRYLAGLGAPPGFVYPDLGAYWREPSRLAYLTVHDGSVAGFALVHGPTDEAMFELVEFYVAPRLRRRGLGRKAAAELFALHPATWLIAVRDDNPSGQAFWSSALAGRDMTVGEVARPPGKLYRVSVDSRGTARCSIPRMGRFGSGACRIPGEDRDLNEKGRPKPPFKLGSRPLAAIAAAGMASA